MNKLLTEILNNHWLIDKRKAHSYAVLLNSLFKNLPSNESEFSFARAANKSFILGSSSVHRWEFNSQDIPENSKAVIPITGVIMKYNQWCGPRGSMSIEEDIKAADANKRITSIILMIDSPGGTVDYTDIIAETVSKSETPVIAYVNGLAASAAYWIASGAKEIIMNSDLAEVGSIGTMVYYPDLQPYFEDLGVKFHEFYASLSTDKNKLFNEVLEGKYDNYRKEVLDPINEAFHAAVKENRSNIDKEALTGKVYFADEAISKGLADSKGSFEFALERAEELGITYSNNIVNKESKSTDMKFKNAWKAAMDFLKISSAEKEEDNPVVNEEHIEKLNKRLEEQDAVIDAVLDLFGEAAKKDKFNLSATVKALQETAAKVPGLEEKLSKRPGSDAPKPKTDGDDVLEDEIEKDETDKQFAELHAKIHGDKED